MKSGTFRGTFRGKGGWWGVAIGCLFGLMAAQPLLTAPLPPPPGLGAKVVGTGEMVTLKIVPTGAAFTSDIFYFSSGASGFLGTNRDSTEITRGPIPEGEEILVHIRVLDTLSGFRTGPAIGNLDDRIHAIVEKEGETLRVRFEDIFGGGDGDFDDVILEIEGARMVVPFAGLDLSPTDGSDFSFGQRGEAPGAPHSGRG